MFTLAMDRFCAAFERAVRRTAEALKSVEILLFKRKADVRNGWKADISCGTLCGMSIGVQKRPYSTGERLVLLVTRALTAAFLTALVGAVENWLYERFFAPELYAAGNPFARGIFMLALTFPYILLGLILLGLPTAYVLMRARAENVFTYALAGAGTGALWGQVAVGVLTTYGIAMSAFYGCVCALFWWWLRPRTSFPQWVENGHPKPEAVTE